MTLKLPFEMTYKKGFIILAILVGFLMPYLSLDFGVHEDSRYHQEHGERLLDYFKGVDDRASHSPINEEGNFVDVNKGIDYEHRGMNGFGGFFDLLSNFLYQFFSFVGIYEFRNIINAIFGFLLFLFCGLLGKELGGWKVGLLSFIFVVLTPVLFGHAMSNPKDIPFAAFYIFAIFHIVLLLKELPAVTLKRALYLIINISLLMNIRLVGLVIIGHVLFAVFSWWFIKNYEDKFRKVNIKDTLVLAIKVLVICILGYLATSVFWPYLQANPIVNPIKLFIKTKEFKGFENLQLFEGDWLSSFHMPWYYMITVLFVITMPLHVFVGFFLIPIIYFQKFKKHILIISFILFAALFPLVIILLGKPNSYDNARQFLFIVPPAIVISSLAWNVLFDNISNSFIKKGSYLLLFFLLIEPFGFMSRNHQLQSLYFGPLIGGMDGAYENYEIDYWGIGIKPAIDWLEENMKRDGDPTRVRMYYGDQLKLSYHLETISHLTYVLAPPNSDLWDYSIVTLAEAKHRRELMQNWPPLNTVYEVKVDDVTICAIIENNYNVDTYISNLEKELANNATVQRYIELSIAYYRKANYFKSIEASKKVITMDPKNSIAYNNLCSAYNRLLMYDEAKKACQKSLEIKPNESLFKNNLQVSLKGIEKHKNSGFAINEYIGLSYNYYSLGYYEKCIMISKELLMIDPNNSTAYNNICASNNVLGNFNEGIKACEKALKLNPGFELAKNNLRFAKGKLNE
ncbi:hypothetical protein [uncultured Aquimarina sp.]|uniref:tetratricopeptide repeat protein n=1 Tax=uncultured Aquimarina sp. TaxID=575652 RepID=UPI00260EEDCE|nr:hypothetical protein [uncultured Aquimarina sp.]